MKDFSKDVINAVKNVLNNPTVTTSLDLGSKVFDAASPFIDKPTVWNGVKAAWNIGKVFNEHAQVWSDDYFAGDEWILPYTRDFNFIVMNAISKFSFQTVQTSDDAYVVRLVDLGGVMCGWRHNLKMNVVENVYVETTKRELAQDIIKQLLWKQYKDDNLVLHRSTRKTINDECDVVFDVDDIIESKSSRRATEYAEYLKRCIDAGVNRSVLLYGPPGTGKSTMARAIINALKMRSFRIRVEDVSDISSSTVFEAVNIFQPDAIILDDFDRSGQQAQLLEKLEFFQKHVKLVIATVNDRNSLDEAILRPGRFDELLLIKQMDEDVVKMVLGEELQDAFETVKSWPIAFIQEYAKRRRFMSKEDAAKSTEELAERVARIERYEDSSDNQRMLRLLEKHAKATKSEDEDDLIQIVSQIETM